MERLGSTKPSGMNGNGLRTWGMICVLAGIVSRSLLQGQMLGVGRVSVMELMNLMQVSEDAMAAATVALILQAIETVAVPIFAFLLVEGFLHTASLKKYLIRVGVLAVVSEIPYNLAMSGSWLDMGSRNPVFGIVLGMVVLYLYQKFRGQKLLCILVGLMATMWAWMLNIEFAIPLILLISAIWIFRYKRMYMGFVGAAAAMLCSGGSMFFLASPLAFLIIHFYNEEKGSDNRVVNYLFYPAALLIIGLAGKFAF